MMKYEEYTSRVVNFIQVITEEFIDENRRLRNLYTEYKDKGMNEQANKLDGMIHELSVYHERVIEDLKNVFIDN